MRHLYLVVLVVACGPAVRDNGDGGGSGVLKGTQCSSDLHDVLDDQGNVVGRCPDDQGCAAGMCVAACDAAAASQGSVGCDFVVATPSFYSTINPPCFAVFLANNWPLDAQVTIGRGSQMFDATMFGRVPNGNADATSWPAVAASGIASSDVGVLFLSHDTAASNFGMPMTCPVPPAVSATGGTQVWNGSDAASGKGTAFHITTSVPVSAYDIMPYGGANSFLPSAELLLPTTAWGTNYVAAPPAPTMGAGWAQVVAATDNTMVTVSPTSTLPGGMGINAAPVGQSSTYTLNANEFIQWQATGEMAGTVLQSNNPISFTGGTTYLCQSTATSTGGGCDSGHQLIPPVSALGYDYVIAPYATRRADMQEESIQYRIVGAADGTTLTFSPAISGAPAALSRGQVAEFQAIGAFEVTSQDDMHPFYVGQYMSGCETTSGSRPGAVDSIGLGSICLGDEEYVNVLPPAQWLSSYVFFTDPTYTTTNLVVTRRAGQNGFQDVTIDCLGVISGWQPVPGSSEYETTNVDLQRITPVGTCTNGRHTASSAGGFTIMVWGLADFSSYAYPAGGNVGKINPVVVIP
jgi:hypothetical protein